MHSELTIQIQKICILFNKLSKVQHDQQLLVIWVNYCANMHLTFYRER